MRIAIVNTTANTNTTVGKICTRLREGYVTDGNDAVLLCGYGHNPGGAVLESIAGKYIRAFHARLFANDSFCSPASTRRLLKHLDRFRPDLLHLHNAHGYYLNLGLVVDWLKRNNVPMLFTMHDCRALTGRCAVPGNCTKWQLHSCNECIKPYLYPAVWNFNSNVKNNGYYDNCLSQIDCHVIVPSESLSAMVSESTLGHLPITVIPSPIDEIFSPKPHKNENNNNLVLFAAAHKWDANKNIRALIELSRNIPTTWQIKIAGSIPRSIQNEISKIETLNTIGKITTPEAMAREYLASDVVLLPSYGESYGLTSSEAAACGTPVIANIEACPRTVIPAGWGDYADFSDPSLFCKTVIELTQQKRRHRYQPVTYNDYILANLRLIQQILGN